MTHAQLENAIKQFRMGFAAGAKPGWSGTTPTEKHWLRGFKAGRAAADSEENAYRKEMNQ